MLRFTRVSPGEAVAMLDPLNLRQLRSYQSFETEARFWTLPSFEYTNVQLRNACRSLKPWFIGTGVLPMIWHVACTVSAREKTDQRFELYAEEN